MVSTGTSVHPGICRRMVTLDKDLRDAGSALHRLFAQNLHQNFIAGLAGSKMWPKIGVFTAPQTSRS